MKWIVTVLVLVVFGCGEEPNIEEIACDEAVTKLSECCEGFPAQDVVCRVDRDGCSRGTHTFEGVQITLRDADTCILHASCDEIRANGVCETATAATRPESLFVAGRGEKAYERLSACPDLR